MENHLQEEIRKTVVPFLLRLAAIILLIGGLFGTALFMSLLLSDIDGSNFPNIFQYNDVDNTLFRLLVFLQLFTHIGFIISSILLLKLKKSGVYLFVACFVMFILSKFIYHDTVVLLEFMFGAITFFLMLISWNSLK